MDILYWIIIAAAAFLNIWLITVFISMAKNVRRILEKLDGNIDTYGPKEVNLAILQGKKQEAYDCIISRLYRSLYNIATCKSEGEGYLNQTAESNIAYSARLCAKLGKELPEQLQSLEAFKEFTNLK